MLIVRSAGGFGMSCMTYFTNNTTFVDFFSNSRPCIIGTDKIRYVGFLLIRIKMIKIQVYRFK